MPMQHYDNPITEVLVKLEQAKRDKERAICLRTARLLLDDPVLVADLLRPRYHGAKGTVSDSETFELTEFERELFCQVATGALTIGQAIASAAGEGEVGTLDEYHVDRIHHMLVMVESEITAELDRAEDEEYVEAGGSFVDLCYKEKLDKYFAERLDSKLTELLESPHGRLHVFIIRTIEGRAAEHEDVRRVLDRLAREGFADELVRDVWERYPIEAAKLGLPKSRQKQASEAAREGSSLRPVSSPLDRPAVLPASLQLDGNVWLTSRDIAERIGADPERVRKRLDRLRAIDHDCFREVAESERKPREARFLYLLTAVRPTIEGLIASSETSSERPAK